MIDAEQMDTFNMNAAQYRVYAAERARERQLAPEGAPTTPDNETATSGPENEASR